MLLAADGTNAGAPAASETQPDTSQTTDDATGTNGGTDAKQATTPAAKTFATEADFQAEVDRILKDRLERAETKAQEKARKAAEQAEAEAAARNGEWKDLAEKRGASLSALETEKATLAEQSDAQKATLARYEKALKMHVEAQSADVPEGVKTLLGKLDPVEQLEWLAANRETLMQQKRQGVPATPGADVSMDETQREAARKEFGRLYNNF
jgi:hypothetical protein